MTTRASTHSWRFFRAGGSDQVSIESAADIANLGELDPKLWVALACPVKGLEFDERTLTLMDADGDGRIRVPEVVAATNWVSSVLRDPAVVLKGGDLALSSIDDSTDEGRELLASARRILSNLGKGDSDSISVADTMETSKIFAETRFNGDGVVPFDAIDNAETRKVAEEIAQAVGTAEDRSGKDGIDGAAIEKFDAESASFMAWWAQGESDSATLLPLGDATPTAYAALTEVRAKVEDFFARCRLAAFDSRSLSAVNRQESEYLTIAAADMTITADEVAGFPIARVEAGRSLPLSDGVNPAWIAAVTAFRDQVVKPILGDRSALTEVEWGEIKGRFKAYEDWYGGKEGGVVESLGIARVRAIAAGPERKELFDLVAQDAALEPEMTAISKVERLARYQRDLFELLNNFVAFRDFYSRERPAVFQAGTLFLDGRSCELCVRVDDPAKHAALAGLAKSYLAYCDCTRTGGETMSIAAAFTDGDSDNLMVGRNGVFWDRQGRDWDATITKVVENPISIREAFWSPYKKLVRLIEQQVAKRAAAGEEAADAKLESAASKAANADATVKPGPEQKKIDVGTVAALGVAFGALATAGAAIAGYFSQTLSLPFWQICIAFAAVILLISTPSMLIAWLKLRQRNLGPILDASGWAVNGRVKMNVPFGGALTEVASLPKGAKSSFAVKYPEPPSVLPKLIGFVIAVAFMLSLLSHFGLLSKVTGGLLGGSSAAEAAQVEEAPAAGTADAPAETAINNSAVAEEETTAEPE